MLDFQLDTAPPPEVEEDDWFGEGNSFESGEELASALLAMATDGSVAAAVVSEPSPTAEAEPVAEADGAFHLFDSNAAAQQLRERLAKSEPARYTPRSWSVRTPGAIALPPRVPGRTGWSIRNSVKVLQHTEEVIEALRTDAVVAALQASARAIHPERASRRAPRFQAR